MNNCKRPLDTPAVSEYQFRSLIKLATPVTVLSFAGGTVIVVETTSTLDLPLSVIVN